MSAYVTMQNVSLTDQQIRAMTTEERRDLLRRLTLAAPGGVPSPHTIRRIRRWRITLMVVCVLVLIPWTIYLGTSLPDRYVANNWAATWVGFDILLIVMLGATAVFGWLRRQLLFLTGFASGVLLISDAWFDVMTSQADDRWEALASAVLLELPLAFILIAGPLRLMRHIAVRHALISTGTPLWRMPIPLPELFADRPRDRVGEGVGEGVSEG